ncbi:MAG: GNAT family N-acetyltransferase [Actinobacteria bacterium]|nr:GNAT family N-acetyltransferase [Actinomycetota bacterium]
MADVSVRSAAITDVGDIARIQVETWRVGYAEILPAAVLDQLSVDTATAAWTDALSQPPTARHHVLVALEQQWVVGFAVLGPDDDPQPADPAIDTTSLVGPILVEPRFGRRGHGSRLLAACVDHARADGLTRAVAWLPEADSVSRSFYGDAGWEADGFARVLDTGAGELREVRIHTSLV